MMTIDTTISMYNTENFARANHVQSIMTYRMAFAGACIGLVSKRYRIEGDLESGV
jgi:hypothetical protein